MEANIIFTFEACSFPFSCCELSLPFWHCFQNLTTRFFFFFFTWNSQCVFWLHECRQRISLSWVIDSNVVELTSQHISAYQCCATVSPLDHLVFFETICSREHLIDMPDNHSGEKSQSIYFYFHDEWHPVKLWFIP